MVSLFLALLAASPEVGPQPLFAEWSECMLDYAQVEGVGSRSEVAIAIAGLNVCATEKARYSRALAASLARPEVSPAAAQDRANRQLAEDQRTIAVRTIAFIRRMRQG